MIKYRYNPNASGMPGMEIAEVHIIDYVLWLNSAEYTYIGRIDESLIPPELLKEFIEHGYIEILDEVES